MLFCIFDIVTLQIMLRVDILNNFVVYLIVNVKKPMVTNDPIESEFC